MIIDAQARRLGIREKGEIPTNNKLLGIEPVIIRDSSSYGGIKW